MIHREITNQSHAIGVVGKNTSVSHFLQRIHRLCTLRARGKFIGVTPGIFFKWYGHVHTTTTVFKEFIQRRIKTVQRHQLCRVEQILTCLRGKGGVNLW